MDSDSQEIVIVAVERDEACLACDFTVERFAEALTEGHFTFCLAHLLRFRVHNDSLFGEPSLRAIT